MRRFHWGWIHSRLDAHNNNSNINEIAWQWMVLTRALWCFARWALFYTLPIIQSILIFIHNCFNFRVKNGALFLTSKKNSECLQKKEVDCCTTRYTISYCATKKVHKMLHTKKIFSVIFVWQWHCLHYTKKSWRTISFVPTYEQMPQA